MVIDKAKGQRWFWTAEKVCLATYSSATAIILSFSSNGMNGSLYLDADEAAQVASALDAPRTASGCLIEIVDDDGNTHRAVHVDTTRIRINCDYLAVQITVNAETAEALAEILRWAIAYEDDDEEV